MSSASISIVSVCTVHANIMAEVREIIAAELKLTKVEPWKRLKGGCSSNNWAFKTEIGEIFAKIDSDKHVS